MDLEELRNYCLSKKGVEEGTPFGNDTLVYKVMDKMFLLTGLDADPIEVNLKCDPEKAIELREKFVCVKPGYHMNKKHWNTITFDNSVSDSLLKQWIDESYDLIVKGLSKKVRFQLNDL